jgi:hypothetical protein
MAEIWYSGDASAPASACHRGQSVTKKSDERAAEDRAWDVELTARGFQLLFALLRGTEDIAFEANDGAWHWIAAYPEYARSGSQPPAHVLAPP